MISGTKAPKKKAKIKKDDSWIQEDDDEQKQKGVLPTENEKAYMRYMQNAGLGLDLEHPNAKQPFEYHAEENGEPDYASVLSFGKKSKPKKEKNNDDENWSDGDWDQDDEGTWWRYDEDDDEWVPHYGDGGDFDSKLIEREQEDDFVKQTLDDAEATQYLRMNADLMGDNFASNAQMMKYGRYSNKKWKIEELSEKPPVLKDCNEKTFINWQKQYTVYSGLHLIDVPFNRIALYNYYFVYTVMAAASKYPQPISYLEAFEPDEN